MINFSQGLNKVDLLLETIKTSEYDQEMPQTSEYDQEMPQSLVTDQPMAP